MTTSNEKSYQERILKVQVYIQNHLNDELTLELLADIANFSPYHFHRIFTAYTGESVKGYLRRLRLERASRDLLFTELTLIQISDRAGYDTQQSFHRAFKDIYGVTPTEFREQKQEKLISHTKKNYLDLEMPSVEIKKIESMQVAFVRHIGSYDHILSAWTHLANEVGIMKLLSENTKKISIAYDAAELTPADKLRYDACISLDEIPDFKPSGKVGIQEIKGGKYAILTHKGPVEKIDETYHVFFGLWLPQSGYEPSDQPNFMLHRNTPFLVKPDELLTDIYLPIK